MGGSVLAIWDQIKQWNPHYPKDDERFLQVIRDTEAYTRAFNGNDREFLRQAEIKALKGATGYAIGVNAPAPWGTKNMVLEFTPRDENDPNSEDVCIKEITVKPGFMLSLQKHRGRAELWEVLDGSLTLIMEGDVYDVSEKGVFKEIEGQFEKISDDNFINIPKGAVHCMINRSFNPVTVRETQRGITREADNIRLGVDFTGRETYPLINEIEFVSAKKYAQIHRDLLISHAREYEKLTGDDAKGRPIQAPKLLLAA